MKKEVSLIGLGKMGGNMAQRLLERKWKVIGYDKITKRRFKKEGLILVGSLEELIRRTSLSRLIWLMVPAGKAVDEILFGKKGLVKFLRKGDIIVDGGNSFYLDSIKRYKKLSKRGIEFVDVGVSGGPEGARRGACLMIGGKEKIFKKLKPLFKDLATKNGFQFFKGAGADHFVKMVHNGIEYGMMQSIAEGFNLLKKSPYKINLQKLARVYNHGSVIESRLVGWLEKAFKIHGQGLKGVSGKVGYTDEGEWTVKTAKKLKVPVKVIEEAFKFRVFSHKKPNYTGKILSALREQFGGHKVTK